MKSLPRALALSLSMACVNALAGPQVNVDSFLYKGIEEVSPREALASNPILPGFFPDPSICRVGADYYLVNSSFAYFPGLPIFHSRDLVNWRLLTHAISRAEQLPYSGLGVSRGIFAPTLRFHDGVFYLICTHADAGGNFYLTARSPEGPWSDPVWLPEIDGIDPSFFFDDDGRAYVINNGPPPDNKPLYEGHRALWMQEWDTTARRLTGPRKIIVNGGTRLADKPVWIEGPHLYKREGAYLLLAAEGGTGPNHSEVAFKSSSPWGPFEPWDANPLLTQRDLAPGRTQPVTCTGHADLVEGPDGNTWAVFLGCRPYQNGYYNTGRETFLLPVTWEKGWPRILPPNTPVPLLFAPPAGAAKAPSAFCLAEPFDRSPEASPWNYLRTPKPGAFRTEGNRLVITPGTTPLSEVGDSTFYGRRQQHSSFSASARFELSPQESHTTTAFVYFQNEKAYHAITLSSDGKTESVALESSLPSGVVASPAITLPTGGPVFLRMEVNGAHLRFSFSQDSVSWQPLGGTLDATLLSTEKAGGFVGAFVGVHAHVFNVNEKH